MDYTRLVTDVVMLAKLQDGSWQVLVIRRGWEPFKGCWALPGGYVDDGETFADAAARELSEEAGLTAPSLAQVGVYDAPKRDPRGRYVSVAFYCVVPGTWQPTAGDDAVDAQWMPVADLLANRALAFDHSEILADAMRQIQFA